MTEAFPLTEKDIVAPKGVTIEDFQKPPSHIAPYIPPGPFTRETVTNGIVYSFILSKGDMTKQKTYLDWLKLHNDPHVYTTLSNFLESGGAKNLTEEERNVLITKFRKRPDHDRRQATWEEDIHQSLSLIGEASPEALSEST